MMEDIYGDLNNYEEVNSVQELRNENKVLKVKLEEHSAAMEKLQKDYDKLEIEFKRMETNYSSLLKTARSEIQRKTQRITQLNMDKDMMVLESLKNGKNTRRNFNNTFQGNKRAEEINKMKNIDKRCRTTGVQTDNYSNSGPDNRVSMVNKFDNVSAKPDLSYKGNSIVREKPMQHKTEYNNTPKTCAGSIKDRRKSMPAVSMPLDTFSSDEENEHIYAIRETRTDSIIQDKFERRHMNRFLMDRNSNKTSETSSIDDRASNYPETSSKEMYRGRTSRYDNDNNSYRSRDKYKTSLRYRKDHSSERGQKRQYSHGEYQDDYYKQEQGKYRPRDNPPEHDRYQRRTSDHRASHDKYSYDHEKYRHYYEEKHGSKQKMANDYDEPLMKRQKTEYFRNLDVHNRVEKEYYNEKESMDLQSKLLPHQYHDLRLSCQSPDFVHTDAALAHPIKEIRSTATMPLEDPRVTSKKYELIKDNGKETISAVMGKNIDIKSVDKALWKIEHVKVPDALMRRPSLTSYELVEDIDMNIDSPVVNLSLESGEIQFESENESHEAHEESKVIPHVIQDCNRNRKVPEHHDKKIPRPDPKKVICSEGHETPEESKVIPHVIQDSNRNRKTPEDHDKKIPRPDPKKVISSGQMTGGHETREESKVISQSKRNRKIPEDHDKKTPRPDPKKVISSEDMSEGHETREESKVIPHCDKNRKVHEDHDKKITRPDPKKVISSEGHETRKESKVIPHVFQDSNRNRKTPEDHDKKIPRPDPKKVISSEEMSEGHETREESKVIPHCDRNRKVPEDHDKKITRPDPKKVISSEGHETRNESKVIPHVFQDSNRNRKTPEDHDKKIPRPDPKKVISPEEMSKLNVAKYRIPKICQSDKNAESKKDVPIIDVTDSVPTKNLTIKASAEDDFSKKIFTRQQNDVHVNVVSSSNNSSKHENKELKNQVSLSKMAIVADDLELSDDNSDNMDSHRQIVTEKVTKYCKIQPNIRQKDGLTDDLQNHSGNKTKEPGNTTVAKEVKVDEKAKNKSLSDSSKNQNSKKKKPKSKEVSKDSIEDTDAVSVSEKKKRSKKEKEFKPKETITKFGDLFGDSSSLMTPEDLGIPTYLPISEDAQDAVDLNINEIINATSIIDKAQSFSGKDAQRSIDMQNVEQHKMDLQKSNPDDKKVTKEVKMKISHQKEEIETDEICPSDVYENLNPGTDSNEPDIVKTVIISSGVQPQITFENNSEEVLEKLDTHVEVHTKAGAADCYLLPAHMGLKQQDILKALATSTPHKDTVLNSVTEIRTNDITTGDSSSTKTIEGTGDQTVSQAPDSQDTPDVRIFVKRRRKVMKRPPMT